MEAPSCWLPLDLLLEVLARSDPVTIARVAATCKLLRRHVAGADFRGRLLRRAGPDEDDHFLVGLFYRRARLDEVRASPLVSPAARSPSQRPPIHVASFMSRNTDLFDSHCLVASADGMIVLTARRVEPEHPGEVCVCDLTTGERASFPRPEAVLGHLYVLLPLEGDGRRRAAGLSSFRLLAADKAPLRTQTLSPTDGGGWDPVTTAPELPVFRSHTERVQPFPVVLGGTAYWLYRQVAMQVYHVVALDVGTGQARSIGVPQACIRRPHALGVFKDVILASVDGEISLVVAEFTAISLWTVKEGNGAARWARSVLIETDMILRSVVTVLPWLACQSIELEWFGQRSGSVVFQMHGVGLVVLNLRTKRIFQLETSSRKISFDLLCPYELDLLSLIASPADQL